MTEPKRNSAWWLVFFAFVLSAVFFSEAYGQHECQGGHNCNEGGGDVSVSTASEAVITANGSRVYALSGGDMDIDDCLATYSVVFGLFQGTNINRLCEAERLNAQGKYQSAAEMKCSLFRFKRIYGKGQKCIDAVIFTEPEDNSPETPPEDPRIGALYARMAAYESEIAEAKEDTRKARIEAQRATTAAQTAQTAQQAPDDMADRRARARLAMKGEE